MSGEVCVQNARAMSLLLTCWWQYSHSCMVFREEALRQQLLDLETKHEASLQQGQQLCLTQEQVIQSTALSPSPRLHVFITLPC